MVIASKAPHVFSAQKLEDHHQRSGKPGAERLVALRSAALEAAERQWASLGETARTPNPVANTGSEWGFWREAGKARRPDPACGPAGSRKVLSGPARPGGSRHGDGFEKSVRLSETERKEQ